VRLTQLTRKLDDLAARQAALEARQAELDAKLAAFEGRVDSELATIRCALVPREPK
jgi:hypothetical protein